MRSQRDHAPGDEGLDMPSYATPSMATAADDAPRVRSDAWVSPTSPRRAEIFYGDREQKLRLLTMDASTAEHKLLLEIQRTLVRIGRALENVPK